MSIHCRSMRSNTSAGSPVVCIRLLSCAHSPGAIKHKESQRWKWRHPDVEAPESQSYGYSENVKGRAGEPALMAPSCKHSVQGKAEAILCQTSNSWKPESCVSSMQSVHRDEQWFRHSRENQQRHWPLCAWVIPKGFWFFLFLSPVLMRNVLMFTLSQGKQNADI